MHGHVTRLSIKPTLEEWAIIDQVSARAKFRRKEIGLTGKEAGSRMGVSAKTLSKFENRYYDPTLTFLCKLGDVLGLSLSDLIDETPVVQSVVSSEPFHEIISKVAKMSKKELNSFLSAI